MGRRAKKKGQKIKRQPGNQIKKTQIYVMGLAVLLALFTILLIKVLIGGERFAQPQPPVLGFQGEYSFDGSTWEPLTMDSRLSVIHEELLLRGHFLTDIPEQEEVQFFLNHIFMSLAVNGEEQINNIPQNWRNRAADCGIRWQSYLSPGITTEDTIEIRLVNYHSAGNAGAYRDFLGTIYQESEFDLRKYLEFYSIPYEILGLFVVAIAMVLLGMAVVAWITQISWRGMLRKVGLLSLFMGGFIILDTQDCSLWLGQVAFANYFTQICMILAVFEIGCCVTEFLTTAAKEFAENIVVVSGLMNGMFALFCITDTMAICDVDIYWMVSQMLFCLGLLGGCAYEACCSESRSANALYLISSMMLLLAVMADLLNAYTGWWMPHICTKAVFLTLFVLHLLRAMKLVPTSVGAAIRAKMLERELEDSKISIMLSQIQPHFLYNSLGAIRELCVSNPRAAEQAVGEFALFLRGNMNSLTMDKPIPFEEELNHTRNYLKLEQLGCGERLKVEFDIETVDFTIPTLTLQPLVENAVRHGVEPKEEGGTVWITVREMEEYIEITVKDDGIGFDTDKEPNDGRKHVGMQNVRERLKRMCNGEVEITSTPGTGTTAVIRLQKEGKSC